jgi:hypothetical protein
VSLHCDLNVADEIFVCQAVVFCNLVECFFATAFAFADHYGDFGKCIINEGLTGISRST